MPREETTRVQRAQIAVESEARLRCRSASMRAAGTLGASRREGLGSHGYPPHSPSIVAEYPFAPTV
ncbi:MAG: hypothetical protein RJA70_4934 [Pseudomonadota bacterium]|jgi:hypothetical protein